MSSPNHRFPRSSPFFIHGMRLLNPALAATPQGDTFSGLPDGYSELLALTLLDLSGNRCGAEGCSRGKRAACSGLSTAQVPTCVPVGVRS